MEGSFHFISFKPHQYLSPFIDYYWFGKCGDNYIPGRKVSVLPIAMHNIVLNYGDNLYRIVDGSSAAELPSNFINGIITKKQEYLLNGCLNFISIRLKPLGLFRFFDVSPVEFIDGNSESKIFNRDLVELYNNLGEFSNYNYLVKQLNRFFLKRLSFFEYKDQLIKPVQGYIDKVLSSRGNTRTSSAYHLSQRRFRTIFRNYTGISPKLFNRIVRFNFVYTELMKKGDLTIQSIIHGANYFDQAHLIKEFRYFVNDTISNYRPDFIEFDELHRY